MNARNRLCSLLVLVAYAKAGYAQSAAQVTLSQANVNDGDPVSVNLLLDNPAACDAHVDVSFGSIDTAAGPTGSKCTVKCAKARRVQLLERRWHAILREESTIL